MAYFSRLDLLSQPPPPPPLPSFRRSASTAVSPPAASVRTKGVEQSPPPAPPPPWWLVAVFHVVTHQSQTPVKVPLSSSDFSSGPCGPSSRLSASASAFSPLIEPDDIIIARLQPSTLSLFSLALSLFSPLSINPPPPPPSPSRGRHVHPPGFS